jgi:hypothetical protein
MTKSKSKIRVCVLNLQEGHISVHTIEPIFEYRLGIDAVFELTEKEL